MFILSPISVNGNGQNEDDGKAQCRNQFGGFRSPAAASLSNEAHYWRDNTAANDGHDDKRRAAIMSRPRF